MILYIYIYFTIYTVYTYTLLLLLTDYKFTIELYRYSSDAIAEAIVSNSDSVVMSYLRY